MMLNLLKYVDIGLVSLGMFDPNLSYETKNLQQTSERPTPCILNIDDGSSVQIYYNTAADSIEYVASVKINTYLALGYGAAMRDTDMVVFESYSDLASSTVLDCYGTNNGRPECFTTSTYTTEVKV